MKLVWDTYFEEGVEAGKIKAQKEMVKKMLALGLSIELIAEATGLTTTEIESLSNEDFDDD